MVSSSVQRSIQSAAGGNVEAIAKVQLYEGSSGSWAYTELEGHVALVSQSGAHILKIFEGQSTIVEFEQELYPGMVYNTNCPHFHFFETDEFVAGFSFGSDSEASQFGAAVKRSIPSPSSSTSSSSMVVTPPPSSAPTSHSLVNRDLGSTKATPASTSSPALSPSSTAKPAASTSQSKLGLSGGGGGGANWKKKLTGFSEKISSKVSEVFTAETKEPEDFVLSGPTGFRHESHIGWDPENGFDVKNIPPEWRKLFQAAGVKKSELQDANTAKFIMQTVQEAMATEGQTGAPPPPPPGGGPPPPPPPPGPPPPLGGPPPPGPAPHGNRAPTGGGGGGGGDLLSQIQQGTQLKKVEEPDLRELDQGKQTSLANTLAAAMAARRGGVSGDANEEEDEWDDDWDD